MGGGTVGPDRPRPTRREDPIRIDPPVAGSGPLLLADITGYTALLHGVSVAHADQFVGGVVPPAYQMVSHLVDGIVERLVPPFTLAKLEGDAVFAYGTEPAAAPHGADLLDCVSDCYAGFHERLTAARGVWTCSCSACSTVRDLELKFVLHHGTFAIQQIAGQRELAGTDVVIAHRLLKNRAAEAVGSGAYLLVSQAAAAALEVPTDSAVRLVETYEHLDPIATYVIPLARP